MKVSNTPSKDVEAAMQVTCKTCPHAMTCFIFRGMASQIGGQFPEGQEPFQPELIGMLCKLHPANAMRGMQ